MNSKKSSMTLAHQEITCEISFDELHETIHDINFDEPQEINTLIPQNKIEKRRNELIELA